MNLDERIDALIKLREALVNQEERLMAHAHRTESNNPWFTKQHIKWSINQIVHQFLDRDKIHAWLENYSMPIQLDSKQVGIVMAGNIPLVGFHDMLCCFITGHKSMIKLSDKDPYLVPYILTLLKEANPDTASYFELVQKLENYDAVIATGSNSTAVHFEYYFKNVPHIIRRNRNAVAVLQDDVADASIEKLGEDVFLYFGLGCRNVSKIYLPESFNTDRLFENFTKHQEVIHHGKYRNNFDYNVAIFMLNKMPYLESGFFILKEDKQIASRIACLHYERYDDRETLISHLLNEKEQIQCVVSDLQVESLKTVPFGESQIPSLLDYADDADTLDFLINLSNDQS